MVGLQKVSSEQWEFLLSFMESHPGMARGTQANDVAHSKLAANQLWDELATSLNNVGSGYPKSVSEWRNYWKRQRYEVRKKACERRAASSTMAGAPPPRHLELTEREERVLRVLGPVSVFGFEFVRLPYVSLHILKCCQFRSDEEPNPSATMSPPPRPEPPRAPAATPPASWPRAPAAPTHEVPDPRTFCTTSLARPRPSRPERSRTPRNSGPVPVSRPYRRFAVPPDVWTLQIEERRLRIEAKRLHYQRQLLAIQERQAKAAEKNNEIMALILGKITKLIQSFEK